MIPSFPLAVLCLTHTFYLQYSYYEFISIPVLKCPADHMWSVSDLCNVTRLTLQITKFTIIDAPVVFWYGYIRWCLPSRVNKSCIRWWNLFSVGDIMEARCSFVLRKSYEIACVVLCTGFEQTDMKLHRTEFSFSICHSLCLFRPL